MRKSIISAIVLGLSLAFVGCPPPSGGGSTKKSDNAAQSPADSGGDAAASPAEGGESQPADAGGESGGESAAPMATDADLSNVKVGQKYIYEMPNNMTATWEVTEVGKNMVKYKTTMMMDMGQGPQAVGEPTEQTWEYKVPEKTEGGETTGEKPDISREDVEVSGHKFDCMVVESEAGGVKTKSWMSMTPGSDTVTTFPGIIKSMSDGKPSMTLTKIEE